MCSFSKVRSPLGIGVSVVSVGILVVLGGRSEGGRTFSPVGHSGAVYGAFGSIAGRRGQSGVIGVGRAKSVPPLERVPIIYAKLPISQLKPLRSHFQTDYALFETNASQPIRRCSHIAPCYSAEESPCVLTRGVLYCEIRDARALSIFRFSIFFWRPSSSSATSRYVGVMRRNIYCAACYILLKLQRLYEPADCRAARLGDPSGECDAKRLWRTVRPEGPSSHSVANAPPSMFEQRPSPACGETPADISRLEAG